MQSSARFLSLLIATFSTLTLALDTDGCFQMYQPSSLYPVICVSGSNEEGIGGRGARVALVGPNSTEVKWCGLTSKIQVTGDVDTNKATYFFEGNSTIRFNGAIDPSTDREMGTVTIGSSTFKYMRLSAQDTKLVLGYMYKSGKCDNL